MLLVAMYAHTTSPTPIQLTPRPNPRSHLHQQHGVQEVGPVAVQHALQGQQTGHTLAMRVDEYRGGRCPFAVRRSAAKATIR